MKIYDFVIEQKIYSRKIIARSLCGYKKADDSEKLKIISKIGKEKEILNYIFDQKTIDKFISLVHNTRHEQVVFCGECLKNKAELAIELPGAPAESINIEPDKKINFGQIADILDKSVQKESENIQSKPKPSQNEIKDWAFKWSVAQYYKNMNLDPATEICDERNMFLRQYAPNKDAIYKLWLDKLLELTREQNKYKIEDATYSNATSDGIPQGGAFEKRLLRFREEFVSMI